VHVYIAAPQLATEAAPPKTFERVAVDEAPPVGLSFGAVLP
jgi:hypothetical protein